ncbi:MAG: hypothetical protein FJY21_08705 [Bacteroidetes bacterium]|nr:hypothetical protein [Bacteroidota bacterium]
MKANKVKTSVKLVKKQTKRGVKKELESTISEKFFEALKSLGHDADKFSKEIKKTSKVLAKKLAVKYNEVKHSVEDKIESKAKIAKSKTVAKAGVPAGKSVVSAVKKAKKVVARVTKAAVKEKLPRLVTTGSGLTKPGVKNPKKSTPSPVSKSVPIKSEVKKPLVAKAKDLMTKKPVKSTKKSASAKSSSAKAGVSTTPPPTDRI